MTILGTHVCLGDEWLSCAWIEDDLVVMDHHGHEQMRLGFQDLMRSVSRYERLIMACYIVQLLLQPVDVRDVQ